MAGAGETSSLRIARRLAAMLPKGARTILDAAARISGSPRRFEAPIRGCDFRLNVELDETVCRTVYVRGCFEPVITQLFHHVLEPSDTFLDIGANFGFFTLLGAAITRGKGQVFAFEPDPLNIERLRDNVRINDFPHVVIVPAAVYEKVGTARLRLGRGGNLGVSSLVRGGVDHVEEVEVETITIDSFLTSRDISSVGLLKMDIEGAEVGALRGASESLKRQAIRYLVIEVHDVIGASGLNELVGLFSGAGYEVRILSKQITGRALSARLLQVTPETIGGGSGTRAADFSELHLFASTQEGMRRLGLS